MLFDTRLGFSGTPSDLIPVELGRCQYEKGSDGKMLHFLTSPEVMAYDILPPDWSVTSLLDRIALSTEPEYRALIDTGALITGWITRRWRATCSSTASGTATVWSTSTRPTGR